MGTKPSDLWIDIPAEEPPTSVPAIPGGAPPSLAGPPSLGPETPPGPWPSAGPRSPRGGPFRLNSSGTYGPPSASLPPPM